MNLLLHGPTDPDGSVAMVRANLEQPTPADTTPEAGTVVKTAPRIESALENPETRIVPRPEGKIER